MTRGAPEAARPAWTLLLAALVLLAGAAVYVDGLAAMRGMLQHDEAYYAVNALSLLEQPRLQFFFPQNTGREALWMYLLAGGLALFGVQPWTLRVVAALVAIVTLAALLRLGRVLFGWRGGLLAALALAGLYLVVHNSHVAFRVLLYPLFGCLALAFLLQAQRHNRAALWRAGGVCAGLLAHTYTAAHGWLALLAALCLLWAWRDAGRRRG
nr:glycosyltransferase family 39 protein [Anaerolineae bacterium]